MHKRVFSLLIILLIFPIFSSCSINNESIDVTSDSSSFSDNEIINQDEILKVGYFTSLTSLDGFQAIGGFERMIFFISNEPLLAIGKDPQHQPSNNNICALLITFFFFEISSFNLLNIGLLIGKF